MLFRSVRFQEQSMPTIELKSFLSDFNNVFFENGSNTSAREDICLIGFASPNFTNFAAVHFFGSSCFNINTCIRTIRYHEDFDKKIMGTAGFEPATSGTQSPNHTKLDYVPCM